MKRLDKSHYGGTTQVTIHHYPQSILLAILRPTSKCINSVQEESLLRKTFVVYHCPRTLVENQIHFITRLSVPLGGRVFPCFPGSPVLRLTGTRPLDFRPTRSRFQKYHIPKYAWGRVQAFLYRILSHPLAGHHLKHAPTLGGARSPNSLRDACRAKCRNHISTFVCISSDHHYLRSPVTFNFRIPSSSRHPTRTLVSKVCGGHHPGRVESFRSRASTEHLVNIIRSGRDYWKHGNSSKELSKKVPAPTGDAVRSS